MDMIVLNRRMDTLCLYEHLFSFDYAGCEQLCESSPDQVFSALDQLWTSYFIGYSHTYNASDTSAGVSLLKGDEAYLWLASCIDTTKAGFHCLNDQISSPLLLPVSCMVII